MNLPNAEAAEIPRAKIEAYLLSASHPTGRHKASFFTRLGFGTADWKALARVLRLHALEHEVARSDQTPYGTRYVIAGPLHAADGRSPTVRSVWFVERGEAVPRFVTAYPVTASADRPRRAG